jgi:hypothetical protein
MRLALAAVLPILLLRKTKILKTDKMSHFESQVNHPQIFSLNLF